MALQFTLAGAQIDGTRGYQEDSFLITNLTDDKGNPSALVIVADGMGGHAAGNVASNMAVQAFNKHVSANYPTEDHATILRECVEMANNSIKETVAETSALAGMGCTLVAAILEKDHLWWVSVGDSHVYLLRNKELIKKNADHSYGGFLDRMEAAGTPVKPEPGLARNMLMSAITGDDLGEVDVPEKPFPLEHGDKILICSDGMDTLSMGKIIQFADWSETPKSCADDLLQAVEDAAMPKQDNTTIVVANISDTEAAIAEEEHAGVSSTQDMATEDSAESGAKRNKKIMLTGIAALVIIGVAVAVFMNMGDKDTVPETTVEKAAKPVQTPADEAEVEVVQAPTEAVEVETEQISTEDSEVDAVKAPAEAVEVETEQIPTEDSEVEVVQAEAEESEAEVVQTPTEALAGQEAAAPVSTETAAPVVAAEPTAPSKEFQDTLKDGTDGPLMVRIAAGEFDMGSRSSSHFSEERPRHTVKVSPFSVSKYEITFEEYEKFAQATGGNIPDSLNMNKATHPVMFVSWDDARNYARWLSEQTGQRYRLPSEAEWEYMAGTGKRSPFWWGYDEEQGRAHCFDCGAFEPRRPTKIGSFEANAFGVYDTAGNVAEWVQDCWHKNYKGAPSSSVVWQGGDCTYRVVRGGAYDSPLQSIRHARRDKFVPDQGYAHIGIRIVRDLE